MTEQIKRGNQIQFFEIVIASTESNTEAIQNSQTKDNNSIVLNNNLNSEYKGGVE